MSSGKCLDKVLRNSVNRHYIRQVNLGSCCARQFYLCLFGSLLKSLESHWVFPQVNTFIFNKLFSQPVNYFLVKVITTEVCVAIGRFHFEDTVTEFEYGYIESTTAKIKNSDLEVLRFFVKSVGKRSCCRFINDPFYI